MTQKQFLKLKKIIDKLLKKAEDEAFEEGLDISSDDFKVLFKKLKERILLEMGISLVEYEMWEKEPDKIAKEKEIAHIEKENDFDEKLKEFKEEKEEIKKLQEEFSAEIEKLAIESKNQISKVSLEFEGEIEGLKDSLKESAERITKVKSLIPSPPKWTDFPEFIRDLNEFEKQFKGFSKTLKNLEGQVIKIDSKPFLKDYSKELKDLRDLISGDKLEHKIHNLLGPPFRKLGMGLSRRINTLDTSLASYVPYTGATANVDLGSNDLTLTGTATFGSATTESLVKILAKSEDYTKGLAVSDASYGSGCVIDGLGIEGVSVDANGNPTAFDEDLDLQYSSTGDLYLCGGGGTVFIEGASLIVSTGILYADGGLDVGTNFVDYTEIAAPTNPSANIARMYSRDDSGTTKLYFRDSAGTETEMGGGGATIELDNLGTVAINTSLISDTDSTDDLGSSTIAWANAYIDKLYLNSTATLDGAVAGKITSNAEIRTSTSLYMRYYHLSVGGFDPGVSGATWTNPDTNITGGWRLNAVGETLIAGTDIHADWDGASDIMVEISFALNAAGSANDTVDLKLVAYYNGVGDTATKTQTVEVATTTDGTQYKVYKAIFAINYDEVDNVVDVGDNITFILNLETDTSEIDDIIVMHGAFYYNTTHLGIESGDV